MTEHRPLILIVDDVSRNLQVVGSFLREAQYDVAAATSGRQALTIAEDVDPDLILLDIMMPDIDGYETCRRLKASEKTKEIPIIFLTAKTAEEDIVHGFELGAVDYITKPFRRQELLERVRVHVELRRSRLELARLVRDKDRLFSIIAHDLRGPLGSFMSIADYVAENIDELDLEEIKPLFREMRQTTRNVYALLENLLEWSRLQLGTITYQPSVFSLFSVVAVVESLVQAPLQQKQLTLENLIGEDIRVFADKQMISIVLRNLVSNAIKYTPRGGRISLEAEKDTFGSRVTVHVRDTGVGMGEEMQKALSVGAQVSSMPGTEREKGTGLGMMLCREMVMRHGQTLQIESAVGEGSTFSFTLDMAE
ncbi:MAG: hybrid sensor histidine kinase/response regulator [Bacteroidetes bacterium]|nr:hybrid sensor histidine kinase/response regulator [Bacteroidota bacterium]